MPWFFAIPEFLKKRACRYLLQHYLGQFLEERISLDDLTVDLYNGTGTINNVPLNVEAINDALQGTSAPVKVVSGYIGRVTVSVPWTALLKDSCRVEISGLALSIAPDVIPTCTDELVSMTDSLFFSMSGSSSMQLAEEVLKSGPSPGEGEVGNSPGFEGMEALARAIELVLARVQVTFKDAVVQVNYRTPDYTQEYFLKVRVRSVEFFDEMSRVESSVDVEVEEDLPQPAAITVKVLQLSGLTVELGSTDLSNVRADPEESFSVSTDTLMGLSPPSFMAPLRDPSTSPAPLRQPPSSLSEDSYGVPIARASRDVIVKVKVKQSETLPGPKLEVEGVVGSLHLLLSPQQLSMLLEMVTGISNKGTSASFERFHPGQNRPIPKSDMRTIESQLRHQLKEQKIKSQQKEDLLHADPWENSLRSGNMGESICSSSDEFFSLDLNSSYAATPMEKMKNMEDSFISTTSKVAVCSAGASASHIHGRCVSSTMESIPLHGGTGLQQLSESPPLSSRKLTATPPTRSPPLQRPRSGSSNVSTTSTCSSPRSTGVRSRRHSESPHDLCKYSLTISGVTIALLEADPMYTYTTPGLPQASSTSSGSPSSSCYGRYSSVDEGGLDPMKYFETMAELLKEGVNKVVFRSEQEKLAHVLPNDHLFAWLSTVRAGVSSEGPQLELDFSVASAELWEYLYRNEASLPHITKPVSVCPILQMVEDSSLSKPCLKLKLCTSGEHSKKHRHSGCSDPQTNLSLSLTTAHLNPDVTLMNRLQPLLHASLHSQHSSLRSGGTLSQAMKHSLYMTNSNYHLVNLQRQAVFNQAVAVESGERREQRINLRINCSTLNISLRFPIPDLREDTRPPWYHPSLRPEVLYVSLSDIRGSSFLHSGMLQGQAMSTFDIQLKDAGVYLSCDGSVEGRKLFLTVSGSQCGIEETESDADLNTASISVVIQPVSDSILEEVDKVPARGGGRGVGSDPPSSYEGFEMPSGEPSPFSKRRAMFSTGKMVERGENGEEVHSEELVMPGSLREMAEFEQHAMSLTRCSVTCTLPSVSVHLPSKGFLETLYNRFATDLVLWQPASPASVEKANAAKSMLYSCMDVLQPAATQEDRFMMCKSVLKEEESDEEGNDEVAQVLQQPPIPHDGPLAAPQGFSTLAFSLNVEKGRVSMITAVEEPPSDSCDDDPTSSVYMSATSDGHLLDLSPQRNSAPATHHEHGLVVATFSNVHAFAVTGYLGDNTHDYFLVQLHEFSLHHLGSLEAANLAPSSYTLEGEVTPILASLCPVISKSRRDGVHPRHASSCEEEEEEPMLAVAMEMRLDKLRNSKTSKCAVALRNTTFQYHMTSMEHSCLKQLGTFFDFVDEPVLGYEPPSLITELHTHLQECAMEYRPLHLPLSVVLMIQSVSLSTNVVTGSPLLVVKLIVDGTYLFLSNCQEDTNQQQDWVCVMEMDWFEMTLRLCNNAQCEGDYQKLFSRLPEISLECSSNTLHLRTCVDSCIALRDLLVYLATNGDLRPHNQETFQLRDYSSLVTDISPPSSLNSYSGPPPLSTLNGDGDIGDLISDAMEDIPSPETSSRAGSVDRREVTARRGKAAFSSAAGFNRDRKSGGRKLMGENLMPKPSKSKMQIHVSNEKSVHVVFDSDSDSESGGGVYGGGIGAVGVHSPQGRLSGSEQGSIFSESDEDFCILDAPTTTKVPLGAQPVVKCLLDQGGELEVDENHFTVPDQHTDQLQRPKHFPEPVIQYTLKEITVIWHLYGGRDFGLPPQNSLSGIPSPSPSSNAHIVCRGSKDGSRSTYSSSSTAAMRTRQYSGANGVGGQGSSTSPVIPRKHSTSPKSSSSSSLSAAFGGGGSVGGPKAKGRKVAAGKRPGGPQDWKSAGGPGRDHNVLMELELDKLRVQYEVYPPNTYEASRLALLVREVEVRDRLLYSQINKFFYQYTTEAMPRQSHANMVFRLLVRDSFQNLVHAHRRVCLKVLFTRPELATQPSIEEAAVRLSVLPVRLNIDQDAVFFLYEFLRQVADTASLSVSDVPASDSGLEEKRASSGGGGERASTGQQPGGVFIRSFVFHPDLPIRVDYEGKRFDTMAVGTLAGILLGLSHLDCSEVRLKALTYKKGLLGWDKVVEYASREWIEDIKGSQLPHILKGVGPVHHVTQLVQGMVDLVWLPVQQYQEDGRIVRGLQRGANSFSASSGVAIVELLSRALHTVQSFAQMAYDLVTPSKQQSSSQALVHQHKAPHEPLDFREGLANAYDVVSAGIGGTARDLVTVATHEHDERGMTGAVGGVLRQLPGTIVKPVILMSEATRHVLGGVKNQFVPDARREATEKWKTTEASEP